ncbi:MFS transporter [Rhodococcoides kyotonense]|uniref:Predicted arabinose efflux permease, MFS family n=1 Tax=Rhodococcoides kyotonense TaxID=398843 RepID=A0A239I7P0_9NOCA|nr:MFS transporter [Rhodococcus kyotonensis]SNS89549.1 Predicted arabinose efflux permease, MFS family [Rhodococcus kyotonensis]
MSRPVAFVAITYAFAVAMMGTTMPTPVYSLYQAEFGFSVLVITVIFAAYALGVLVALLAFGRWSDSLGRRPMLLAGIAFGIGSALVFVFAGNLEVLLIGRMLSGLSAGIFVGTATVTLVELVPDKWKTKAPSIATAANIGGLGLGPLVAGLLVQYLPEPTHLTFIVHIVLLAIAAVAVFLVPEPVAVQPGARPHMQRLSVPAEIRGTFVRAAIGGFAGFAVLGLFSGVSPGFMTTVLGVDNHAVGGAVVFVIFAASAAAQIGLRGLDASFAQRLGCLILVLGCVALGLSLLLASFPLLVVAAVVCGVGQGITFSKGMASVTAELPAGRRAEVTSTFFVVLYIAISVPVIGAGAAANAWGLVTAGVVFSTAVALLAAVSFLLLVVRGRQDENESENS